MEVRWLGVFLLSLLLCARGSEPTGNRFVDAGPARFEDVLFGTDASGFTPLSACEHDFSVAWSAQVGAAAYATPVVSRVPAEPSVRVASATFSRYVEVLRGSDGHEVAGWPYEADGSLFHASPLPHDLDGDGVDELVLVSYDGEVTFVRQQSALPLTMAARTGGGREPLALRVPRLRVRREWSAEAAGDGHPSERVGGLAGHEEQSEADDAQQAEAEEAADEAAADSAARGGAARAALLRARADAEAAGRAVPIGPFGGLSAEAVRSFELFADEADDTALDGADELSDGRAGAGSLQERQHAAEARAAASGARAERQSRLRLDDEFIYVDAHVLATPTIADVDGDGRAEELVLAVSYFFDEPDSDELLRELPPRSNAQHLAAAGIVVFRLPTRAKGAGSARGAAGGSGGNLGLLFPPSAVPAWSAQLDVTRARTDLRALCYGSPTVADLEGDGELEIVVGTSSGYVYVLSVAAAAAGAQGGVDGGGDGGGGGGGGGARGGGGALRVKEGWPVRLAEVQGQVAAEDVAGGPGLELIAADGNGNVVVWDSRGTEVWSAQIGGLAARGVAVGDVNGDGQLDVVAATTAGSVHALDGETGRELGGFPVRAAGRIMALPLLIRLAAPSVGGGGGRRAGGGGRSRGGAEAGSASEVFVVVPAFDGCLYVVSGQSGCTFKLDLGEHAYSQAVPAALHSAAAPSQPARLDLLLTTMGGTVLAIETSTPAHPLRVRGGASAAGLGRPGALAEGGFGAHFAAHGDGGDGGGGGGSGVREVVGESFSAAIVIADGPRRRPADAGLAASRGPAGAPPPPRYAVQLLLAGTTVAAFNTSHAGAHTVPGLPALGARSRAPLRLRVTNGYGQVAEDLVVVSFNSAFYRAIKWLVAAPALTLGAVGVALLPVSTARRAA